MLFKKFFFFVFLLVVPVSNAISLVSETQKDVIYDGINPINVDIYVRPDSSKHSIKATILTELEGVAVEPSLSTENPAHFKIKIQPSDNLENGLYPINLFFNPRSTAGGIGATVGVGKILHFIKPYAEGFIVVIPESANVPLNQQYKLKSLVKNIGRTATQLTFMSIVDGQELGEHTYKLRPFEESSVFIDIPPLSGGKHELEIVSSDDGELLSHYDLFVGKKDIEITSVNFDGKNHFEIQLFNNWNEELEELLMFRFDGPGVKFESEKIKTNLKPGLNELVINVDNSVTNGVYSVTAIFETQPIISATLHDVEIMNGVEGPKRSGFAKAIPDPDIPDEGNFFQDAGIPKTKIIAILILLSIGILALLLQVTRRK